ncbi:hypothetical protein P280DRAFT_477633 [Massarina eburnea CBS 473.64]|uniref:Uncharacterized protein n=1 Tax=Massarina eburnea CBS 473.64 TaxID=1395130 RepID=A0A6A6S8Q1_9PLEO|nr:hypothetical protein P280DRAFT_477633 [Massarina eburnea CBS 473.64]
MSPRRNLRDRTNKRKASKNSSRVATPAAKRQKRPAPATPSGSLFELPRELRDLIYHSVWLCQPAFPIMYRSSKFFISYSVPYRSDPDPPPHAFKSRTRKHPRPWFLASKSLLLEAMEQFHRGATARYTGEESIFPNSFARPNKLLVNPWKCNIFDLGSVRTIEQVEIAPNERDMVSIVEVLPPDSGPLRHRGNGVTGSPSVRILRLEICAISHWQYLCTEPERDIEIHFEVLEGLNLPSLNVVELEVSFDTEGSGHCGDETFTEGLKEGVKELGSFLVGGDARERGRKETCNAVL